MWCLTAATPTHPPSLGAPQFRQAMVALAQTLHVAPGLPPPPAANLPPGHEAAVAVAHQRVVAVAEQLPPQHDVEAFAARLAGQLPDSTAAPAALRCAMLAASSARLQQPPAAALGQGSVLPAGGLSTIAAPAAEPACAADEMQASGSGGCALEEGGDDSSGEWVPAVQQQQAQQQAQQQQAQQQQAAAPDDGWGPRGVPLAIGGGRAALQQQQPALRLGSQPWQRAAPSDGWGIPGIPLVIGGGRSPSPALPVNLTQPPAPQAATEQALLPPPPACLHEPRKAPLQPQPQQEAPQPQPQPLLGDPGDGWGVPGMPLLLGGGSAGRTCVLAQVLATCESQSTSSEVFTAEGRALQALGVPPPNNPTIRRRVEVSRSGRWDGRESAAPGLSMPLCVCTTSCYLALWVATLSPALHCQPVGGLQLLSAVPLS